MGCSILSKPHLQSHAREIPLMQASEAHTSVSHKNETVSGCFGHLQEQAFFSFVHSQDSGVSYGHPEPPAQGLLPVYVCCVSHSETPPDYWNTRSIENDMYRNCPWIYDHQLAKIPKLRTQSFQTSFPSSGSNDSTWFEPNIRN